MLCGLWLWNLRLIAGVRRQGPLPEAGPLQEAEKERGEVLPPLQFSAPPPVEAGAPPPPPTEEAPPKGEGLESEGEEAGCAAEKAETPGAKSLATLLGELDLSACLKRRPGWSWSPVEGLLRDHQGHALHLLGVERLPEGANLRFGQRLPSGGLKQASVSVTRELGEEVGAHFGRWRSTKGKEPPPPPSKRVRERRESEVRLYTGEEEGGSYRRVKPLFLAAEARRQGRASNERWQVEVEWRGVSGREGRDPHPLLAATERERGRGRRSYRERLACYAAPKTVEVEARESLRAPRLEGVEALCAFLQKAATKKDGQSMRV